MPQDPDRPRKSPLERPKLPISPPSRDDDPEKHRKAGTPDLRFEEIEEKHIPKDRNIFDK